jgi:uncharacterized protein with PQ loop repeat
MTRAHAITVTAGLIVLSAMGLAGCEQLAVRDVSSLLVPTLKRSEVVGFVAGLGTTFAAVPDLLMMLKRRSSDGMNPRMAAITGLFQILWVYYGLLILSRPVITWNTIAVVINLGNVVAYAHFSRRARASQPDRSSATVHPADSA